MSPLPTVRSRKCELPHVTKTDEPRPSLIRDTAHFPLGGRAGDLRRRICPGTRAPVNPWEKSAPRPTRRRLGQSVGASGIVASLSARDSQKTSKRIIELKQCTKEYGLDLVLVQETFLKPSRPRSCGLPGYVQLRTDRTDAPLGGTAIYYKRSLRCCPIDLPTLSNIEAKVVKS
ncbi:hypothetical protein EVAR_98589_1 [Eumeta japonica]|uniref:RNA-directed DNA polymerase from mobile element jockey n=1 Tax=Eumeta variegata TaxID=151549 RepID=A0A4C1T452_EUMVA|nr:hypothetical protein EVAR_98589_1 [Eumeta japonica]